MQHLPQNPMGPVDQRRLRHDCRHRTMQSFESDLAPFGQIRQTGQDKTRVQDWLSNRRRNHREPKAALLQGPLLVVQYAARHLLVVAVAGL